MKKLDPGVILARLQKIRELLEFLEQYDLITFEQYCNDPKLKLSYERTFQLLVDCTLDINRHILSTLFVEPDRVRDSNRDDFRAMSSAKILTLELAETLADAAGMRNILVHMYLEIDNALIFHSIARCRDVYPQYIRQVLTYLARVMNSN